MPLRLRHQVRTTNLRISCQAQPRLRRTRAAYYPRQRAHPRQDPTYSANTNYSKEHHERINQCPLIRNSDQRLLVTNHSNSRQPCRYGYHRRSNTVFNQIRTHMQATLTKIRDFLLAPASITKLDYLVILIVALIAAWN